MVKNVNYNLIPQRRWDFGVNDRICKFGAVKNLAIIARSLYIEIGPILPPAKL